MSEESAGIHISQPAGPSLAEGVANVTGMEVEDSVGLFQPNNALKRGRSVSDPCLDQILTTDHVKKPVSPVAESLLKKAKVNPLGSSLDHDVVLDDTSVRHVLIKCIDPEKPKAFAHMSPFKTIELLHDLIGEYVSSKPIKSGALLIECCTRGQVTDLLNLSTFAELPVKVDLAFFIGTVMGL